MLTENALVFWVKIRILEFVLFVKCQRFQWNNLSKGVILPNLDSCRFEQNWLMEMSVFFTKIFVLLWFFTMSVHMECGKFMWKIYFSKIFLSLFLPRSFNLFYVGNLSVGEIFLWICSFSDDWAEMESCQSVNWTQATQEKNFHRRRLNEWTHWIWSNRSNVMQITTNR